MLGGSARATRALNLWDISLPPFLGFWGMVSCSSSWSWIHHVARNNHQLLILLSLPHYTVRRLKVVPLFLVLCGVGDWIHGLMHTRQALNQLNFISRSPNINFSALHSLTNFINIVIFQSIWNRFYKFFFIVIVTRDGTKSCTY